jgi:serine/threonine-protein kinase
MDTEHNGVHDGGERLDQVIAAYLKAAEAGQAGSRDDWLARYPDLAGELTEFFAGQDQVDALAGPLREAAAATTTRAGDASAGDTRVEGAGRADESILYTYGNYDVLSVLAQGGMGVVYKARQKNPRRLVALKMIRTGPGAAPADVQRFRNETEVIASLDHPHIIPIYEVGEHEGCLYFSMKLLEGGPLTAQVARFTGDMRAAARLLIAVARAVHHAHQRGILHRDLKPSNILLDAEGRPHVTDFGLAKRVEADSGLTHSGAVVGTPSYMAPEQAAGQKGQITTATDVYGLGAVLYALLTGRPPFQGCSVLETLEQVKQREPDNPSRSNPAIDRDLQTICLKCLQKEPARRYASAEALAGDLDCWLARKPIQARAIGRVARLWRWCRRNPVGAALVGTAALAVIVLAVSTVLIWREKERTQAALTESQTNYKRAEAQRQRAETNFREAYWAVEGLLRPYDMDPSLRRLTLPELRHFQTETALLFLARFREDPSEEPDRRLQKGAAYVHTGRVYQVLGDRGKAQEAFLQAIAVFDRLVQEFPGNPTYRNEHATALSILADDLYESGRTADGHEYARQAASVLREAIRRHPENAAATLQLASMLCYCPDSQLRDPSAALELARKAVKLAPDDPNSWIVLGVAYYRTQAWEAAIGALQKALRMPEARRNSGEAYALYFLGMAQWQLGRQEEAKQTYGQAAQSMEGGFRKHNSLERAMQAEAASLLGIDNPSPQKVNEETPRKD